MSDHARVLERVRQSRETTAAALRAQVPPASSATEAIGGAFARAARVFDTVTGEEGEVLGGTRENVIVPTPQRGNR